MSNHKETKAVGNIKSASLVVENDKILQALVGVQNANLKTIESSLQVKINHTNSSLLINGQDSEVNLAIHLLTQLKSLVSNGENIFPGDVERAIKLLARDRRAQLEDLYRDQVKIAGKNKSIVPKTKNQKLYLEAINNNDVIFGVGPAGTGKTYLAMAMAVAALMQKTVKRLVLCRPAVEAGERLGFLPGDMAEKVNPYLRPLYDALYDMMELDKAKELIEKGQIEVAPLAFMRGRTLSNAFVILDEAQNTTSGQMKMLLTRLGENSKCIVTGDITQIDLPRGINSGLIEALSILKNIDKVKTIYFDRSDVVRHKVVAAILKAYEEIEGKNQ